MLLREFSSPLLMTDLEPPQIEPDEVLVKVRACGICHSDVKIWSGLVPTVKLPRILGHEVAGEVVEVGHKVKNVDISDRVIVYGYSPCGKCYFCRNSEENLCSNVYSRLGFERDGGFGEYVKATSSSVFKFSEKIPFEKMAIVPCSVIVPFHAIKQKAKVSAGDDVAVVGLGGLGIHALQIAKVCGANVFGITDIMKQFDPGDTILHSSNATEEVKRATGGKGVDVVIDTVGIPATLAQDFKMIRPGGRIVMIGYEYGAVFQLPIQQAVYNDIEILGSRGGTPKDLVNIIKLIEIGRIEPVVVRTYDLAEANTAMEYLVKEKPPGRIVLVP